MRVAVALVVLVCLSGVAMCHEGKRPLAVRHWVTRPHRVERVRRLRGSLQVEGVRDRPAPPSRVVAGGGEEGARRRQRSG
jgi:hypothetical protein